MTDIIWVASGTRCSSPGARGWIDASTSGLSMLGLYLCFHCIGSLPSYNLFGIDLLHSNYITYKKNKNFLYF